MIEGLVLALDRANVDTDQIIPAHRLVGIDTSGLGQYLFAGMPGGATLLAEHPEATVLVARENFGCGSSREHAPIAMGSADCEVVLAESFARIFFRNCVATGELYPCECLERLCEKVQTGDIFTVDLDATKVMLAKGDKTFAFKSLGDVRPVVDAGGLFNYARQTGMIAKRD